MEGLHEASDTVVVDVKDTPQDDDDDKEIHGAVAGDAAEEARRQLLAGADGVDDEDLEEGELSDWIFVDVEWLPFGVGSTAKVLISRCADKLNGLESF